jgi:hypothetical protein
MPTDNVVEFVSRSEQKHMVFAAVILPLARMIHSGALEPEAATREQFFQALQGLGRSHDDAFEIHVTRVPEEMRLVTHCVAEGEAQSGVVLLFTLLEGEINSLLRMHLSIRGFTANAITDALRGTDFNTKLDVLLPLLEVTVPERLRNAALQCKAIRNAVVHNKAMPSLMADVGNKQSDTEYASERAAKFFLENPIQRLQEDLEGFMDGGLYANPAVQWSRYLFEKYFEA